MLAVSSLEFLRIFHYPLISPVISSRRRRDVWPRRKQIREGPVAAHGSAARRRNEHRDIHKIPIANRPADRPADHFGRSATCNNDDILRLRELILAIRREKAMSARALSRTLFRESGLPDRICAQDITDNGGS